MAKRKLILEIDPARTPEPPRQPRRRRRAWLAAGGAIAVVVGVGAFAWLRAPHAPATPAAIPPERGAAVMAVTTGRLGVAVAVQPMPARSVPAAHPLAATGVLATARQPDGRRPGAIRVNVVAPEHAAAFLAGTDKRLRIDGSEWQSVATFPHVAASIEPGPHGVRLEVDSFDCTSLLGTNEAAVLVDPGRTNELEFVLSPKPAFVTVTCNVTNALVQTASLRASGSAPLSVSSLLPLTVTVSAPGYRKQALSLDALLPGSTMRREVTLERETGALRIEAIVPANAAAYFQGLAKSIRLGANAGTVVSNLPHVIDGLSCEAMPVELQVEGFDVGRGVPAEPHVFNGRTVTVTFVTTPMAARLTVCCNVTNAEAQVDARRITLDAPISVPSLCPLALTVNATGYVPQTVKVAAMEPGKTYRHEVKLEPEHHATPFGVSGGDAGKPLVLDLGSGVKLELVWIPPGSFLMGSPESEDGRFGYETQHPVTISKGFWMGRHEVTQGQWQTIMGSNPSRFKEAGAGSPVEQISWDDCQGFLRKLNESGAVSSGGRAKLTFRLPTEAEWEYACRAGTAARFNTGGSEADADRAGWYGKNSKGTTHPVGQKTPNAWGLYDMHGNVWEWCSDRLRRYTATAVTDPLGLAENEGRVIRGGAWNSSGDRELRSARRYYDEPAFRSFISVGVRLVMSETSGV